MGRRQKIRFRLRRLWTPGAVLAYASILARVLDAVQRADFLGRIMDMDGVISFISDWGWIAGVAWLAYLVLTPVRRETIHAENALGLRRQLVRLILSIERISILYEMPEFSTTGHRLDLEERRLQLHRSMADLLEYVLDGVPDEFQETYRLNAVAGAIVDLMETPQEQLSTLARETQVDVATGLDLYLARFRNRETGEDA